MKRLLLFEPSVETLHFFSDRIAEEYTAMGYDVRIIRIHEPFFGLNALTEFIIPHETVMITFNYHGIQREAIFHTEAGVLLWDLYDVACINIIVDHPFYYYEELRYLPKRYMQICIDEDHTDYMHRFYPEIHCGKTMPLAGCAYRPEFGSGSSFPEQEDVIDPARHFSPDNRIIPPVLSPAKRSTSVVFTGCYTPPDFFLPYMKRNGADYDAFYHGILDDLLADPDQCIHTVYLRHLNRELPELTKEELKNVMNKMIFLDLWIRFTFRGEAIRTLLDADIPVHCIGAGWDKLPTKHDERLTHTEYSDTKVCLKALSEAKVSMNVMPWFKRGAHDRIYSSMLNGAVCVTDGSEYLHRHFKDRDTLCYYSLKELHRLPEIVTDLLAHPDTLEDIASRAYTYAKDNLTWKQFAKDLESYFTIV